MKVYELENRDVDSVGVSILHSLLYFHQALSYIRGNLDEDTQDQS